MVSKGDKIEVRVRDRWLPATVESVEEWSLVARYLDGKTAMLTEREIDPQLSPRTWRRRPRTAPMTDPTDDEIERIRARDEATPRDLVSAGYGQVHNDRRTLLAALDAERAEAERLRGELDGLGSWRGDFERVRRHISTDPLAGAATVIADHNAAKQRVRDQARRAALDAHRGEVERLRHALQVAHDWMGRAPDNDCDEGGGWGHAHLRTAEETVLAALLDGPGATEDA